MLAKKQKPQTLETNSPILIDSATLGKKDSLHILHVDDDVCILEISKQILSDENNFEIDMVTSVDEAFKRMENQTYDAIVSDYEMPLKNGLEFLKELRAKKSGIPFILFTGKGREEVVVKALNLGADSYINKNGSPETVYCELADAIHKTVERKKSRELIARSESKYRALVENSLQGISILLVAPLRIVFANDAMGKILGYSSQDLMSLSPEEIMGLVYHEDRAVFFKRMENRLRGEPAESCFEFRAVRKDGSLIWLSSLAHRVDYDGQPAVQGMFLDINESKAAGEVLRESEQRYRELANCLPDIVFETDLNGQLVFVNERALEISGYSQGELEKGLNIMQFLLPEDREKATKNIQRLISGGSYTPTEYTFVRKNGTTFPALITATPCISKNKVTGFRGLVLDITERKTAEKELQENETKFRMYVENSPVAVFVADSEGKYEYMNEAASKLLGYPARELVGMGIPKIIFKEELSAILDDFAALQETGKIMKEYKLKNKDGEAVFVSLNAVKLPNGKLIGFCENIAERKKAEQTVSASLKRYQSFIEVTGELGWTTNAAGEVEEDIPSFRSFTGQIYDEVKGWGWTKAVHPDDLEHATQAWQAAVEAKTKYEVEYRLRRFDGVYRNFMARGAPIQDEDGKIGEWVGTCIDVTDRKEAEEALNRTMDKLVRVNEKLGVVGSLTRHDVRNKLLAVTGNAFLLKKKHPDQTDITEGLRKIEQSCKEIGEILEFGKMYEQLDVEELTYISVEEKLNEAMALFSGSLNVKVINDCRGLALLADSFVRQLFFNLIDNSIKHGKKATTIRVHFDEVDQDKLNLIYEDDGFGIPVDNKPKLFKCGFSTGGSSGYGLYLIRKMIEVYGWAIQENGESDEGAKFTITIPRINQNGKENFRIA